MKHALWILLVALIFALSSCTCGAKPEQVATAKRVAPAPQSTPESHAATQAPKKEMPQEMEQDEGSAVSKPLSKKELMGLMPDLTKEMQAPEFKQKVREAMEKKDFKGLLQAILETQMEVCKKHDIRMKDFVEAMNKYKDDPEVKKLYENWRDAITAR